LRLFFEALNTHSEKNPPTASILVNRQANLFELPESKTLLAFELNVERNTMIYYRIAFQIGENPTWRWRSTPLTSLESLLGFLKTCTCVPKDSIRVFFSSSAEKMDEMLTRQNRGEISNSISARQFLSGKSINSLEVARLESELGLPGDCDTAYTFTPPTFMPQAVAWMKLLAKVQNGELEP
jgi:hypothetical protein